MKRFVFNLQAVLEQRAALEEIEQRKVATLERERMAIEDRIRGYQKSIISAKSDLRAQLETGASAGGPPRAVSLGAVRLQAAASLHLVAKAQQAVFELAGLHRRLEGAREVLRRATTARKSVELLKARRYEEWRTATLRAEVQEADEMVVMRHARGGEPGALRADGSETGPAPAEGA
jgi:flagellar export protein FliJ